jgi:2-oxo-4-hydroxy-4-carboxy--5-ureidoimidazoline (OHCU) decarboxylase
MASWDTSYQSEFIAGHPRIGESKNLSSLSAEEQGATAPGVIPTPPEVLACLSHLNTCYETKYTGLRYITFVNGRTRRAIAEEMEDVSRLEWQAELSRAIQAVG